MQDAAEHFGEFGDLERLGEKLIHARGKAPLAVTWQHIGGEGNDGNPLAGLDLADFLRCLQPVHHRHLHVHEDGGIFSRRKNLERPLAIGGKLGPVTQTFEHPACQDAAGGIVFHHENRSRLIRSDASGFLRPHFFRASIQNLLRPLSRHAGRHHELARETESKRAPFVGSGCQQNCSSHGLRKSQGDCEPQASALERPVQLRIHLGKRLEQVVDHLGWNSRPRILHGKIQSRPPVQCCLCHSQHHPSPRREFDRITEQVDENLPDPAHVADDFRRNVGCQIRAEFQPLVHRDVSDRTAGGDHKLLHTDFRHPDRHAAFFDA